MENYFNYFTEIEEHFQRRRGSILFLSTLDWALIETWKDAGIPLEAVLRGIDDAFDKHEKRRSTHKKVNGLAYCAQAVLTAAEDMKEAAVGGGPLSQDKRPSGFETEKLSDYLERNARELESADLPAAGGVSSQVIAQHTAKTLRALRSELNSASRLEELERALTVLEEKLVAGLMGATPDGELVNMRAEADRELAPYRSKMPAAQIDHLFRQYLQKRLLERYRLPRLSLFYM
ncbi:MAG: hypothetical protein H0X25_12115 [Acidobacteriales bacterium]|nr:hypothetical protein [Terriglobales bacterium]